MLRSFRFGWMCVPCALVLLTLPLNAGEEGKGGGRGFGAGMGGFFGGGIDKPTLLRMEQVQKELKVTDEQKTKIDAVLTASRERMRGQMPSGGLRDLPQEEREKKMAEFRDARKKANEETEKELAKVLTADQSTRLDEITLQQRGAEGLKDEKVAKKLDLTKDQLTKIDEALAWGQAEQRKLMGEGRGQGKNVDREAFKQNQEKRDKIRKDMEAKALEALSKDQKEKFEKMKGKAFELDRSAIFRGGRGGAGGKGAGKSTI